MSVITGCTVTAMLVCWSATPAEVTLTSTVACDIFFCTTLPAEAQPVPAKKASKAQKRREKDEHERQVRERELARVAESGSQPQSAEDFERLVMGDPNSSMVWIQYMAFLISLGEVEKARGTAERGLATINYRFVPYRHRHGRMGFLIAALLGYVCQRGRDGNA